MPIARPPILLRKFYRNLMWRVPTDKKVIYLTFDDGPIPEVTPWVLSTLKQYGAKATFFCVGENVARNSSIYTQILEDGHAVGNHTHNHLKGWSTANEVYLSNVAQCAQYVPSELFRPPYGRIRRQQIKQLMGTYKLIMWDVLSYDYSAMVTPEKCLQHVINNARPGSIVVFHDHQKAFKNMSYALPLVLAHFGKLGFQFEPLAKINLN